MGETGIGKTALINLLSTLMDCNLFILNIHSGKLNFKNISRKNRKGGGGGV